MRASIALLLIISSAMLVAIDVAGTQSGTWTIANSPYNVTGDITVPQGSSLIIEPGVVVNVGSNFQITAQGHISAVGTENDTIYFTSDSRWKGFRLESTTVTSVFNHCKIEKVQDGIRPINSPVDVINSHINDASNHCIDVYGINGPAVTNIKYSKISGATKAGISISQNSNVTIEYCDIYNNGLGTQYYGGIHLQNQSASGECDPLIQYNRIHNNLKQGINGWDVTSNSRINPIVKHNIIESNLTGLNLRHVSGLFENNQVINNFIVGNANSGAGFMIAGASASPIIRNNEVTGNYTAFYIGEGATPVLGDINSGDPLTGRNIIQNNIDESNTSHSVYIYSGNGNVMAQNNIWDSTDPDEIAASIYDQNDNPSLGLVTFLPVFSESTINGNIAYNGTLDFAYTYILLYDYVTESYVDMQQVDGLGNYEISVEPGKYWVFAIGTNEANFDSFNIDDPSVLVAGVFSLDLLPAAVIVNDDTSAESVSIEMYDLKDDLVISLLESISYQGDTAYTLGIFKDHLVNELMIIRQDGDFIKVIGNKSFDAETDEWVYNFGSNWSLIKTDNFTVGEMWGIDDGGLVGMYTGEIPTPIIINGESIEPHRFLFFEGNASDNDDSENELFGMTQYYQDGIGIVSFREFDTETNSLKDNHVLYSYDISHGGDGIFPIAVGNIWKLEKTEAPNNPTNLIAINLDELYLLWEPAFGADWSGYNVYRDNQLYDQSISSFFYQPEDIDINSHSWYVTAFNENSESEPSNIYHPLSTEIPNIVLGKVGINHYPNPIDYQKKTIMSFNIELPDESNIELNIYNIKGQKVANVAKTKLSKGNHKIRWNALNQDQKRLASGVYFYQLKTKTTSISRKMLILN